MQVGNETFCDSQKQRRSRAGSSCREDPGGGYGNRVSFDAALRSTFFENLTPPGSRAEGACVLVVTVGSNIRGFICPTSAVIATVPGFGLSGTNYASLNLTG